MKIKHRAITAFILSFILLLQGIGTMDGNAYSSFVSLEYQSRESVGEVIRQASGTSAGEKICTPRMIFGNRDQLVSSNKSIASHYLQELRILFSCMKNLLNQFFYYIIVSEVFFLLFGGNTGILRYIHNQDGEK